MTTTVPSRRSAIAEIPVLHVADYASADLCRYDLDRVYALMRSALGRRSHFVLPFVVELVDRISHGWLARQADSYLDEIRHVARLLGRPGTYFLNAVYEWSCSTSVGPALSGEGARMIRVLDWGLAGIGRHVVIACHPTERGPFYNATWPGYAGVVNAMAPGRFCAAINQAPRMPVLGIPGLDAMIMRSRIFAARDTILASHLLRQVFETAPDYAAAVDMLTSSRVALAAPALFTLSGMEPDEGCVIEAFGRQRRLHRSADAPRGILGVANQWLSPDLKGKARNESVTVAPALTPEANNALRRAIISDLQAGEFRGTRDLAEPVLNSQTVMVVIANAASGQFAVEALDPLPGEITPRVVARRSLHHV